MLDVIIAELADLHLLLERHLFCFDSSLTYLISARTRPEAFVREIELLHAERAYFFFVIVDELILLSRHGGCDVTREGRGDRGGAPGLGWCHSESRVAIGCREEDREGPVGFGGSATMEVLK